MPTALARPHHAGDVIFLTSDGVADNFDPVVRKIAVSRAIGEISSRSQDMAVLGPTGCHTLALADMAAVLRNVCYDSNQQELTALAGKACSDTHQQKLVAIATHQQQQQLQLPADALVEAHTTQRDPVRLLQQRAAAAQALQPWSLNLGACLSPAAAVQALLSCVWAITARKRALLESPLATSSGPGELADLAAALPGKPDHASVVAYRVGGGLQPQAVL
jgi:hypothetical protein